MNPTSPISTLSPAVGQLSPQPLDLAPVTASPIPAPQQQSQPDQSSPEAGGILRGLYGRTLGKMARGLGLTDTDYAIDPDTGKTVATPVKAAPGELSKAILSAGLLGMHGIGPQGGQQNFAQGLLAGLSGGMDASRQLQQDKENKARVQAQQQFENELRTKESARQDKDIQMRQTLTDAQIATFNVDRLAKSYELVRLKNEDQMGASQTLVARDKPLVDMYSEANVQPISTGHTAADFQKLLEDDKNDIDLHKVVAVITGYEAHRADDGTISYQPVGSIYPVATQFTPSFLADMRATGIKEDDPLYKEVSADVQNKTQVDPRRMIAVQNEMNKRFDYSKTSADIAYKNSETARSRVAEMHEGIEARLANLQLQDAESIRNGKDLFSIIGDPKGMDIGSGKNKTHITIPTTPKGGYDFSKLTPKQKSDVRDYINAAYGQAYQDYDRIAQAVKSGGHDPAKDPQVQKASDTLSSLNNMLNSLNGTAHWPGDVDQGQDQLTQLATVTARNLSDPQASAFKQYVEGLDNENDILNKISSSSMTPEDKKAVADAVSTYFKTANPLLEKKHQEENDASQYIENIIENNQEAPINEWKKNHPILNSLGSPTLPFVP